MSKFKIGDKVMVSCNISSDFDGVEIGDTSIIETKPIEPFPIFPPYKYGYIITEYIPNRDKDILIMNSEVLEGDYKIDKSTGVINFDKKDINKAIKISYEALLPEQNNLNTLNNSEKDNKSTYYVIANDEKVVAKANEEWIAYEIMSKFKDQFDNIVVCKIN